MISILFSLFISLYFFKPVYTRMRDEISYCFEFHRGNENSKLSSLFISLYVFEPVYTRMRDEISTRYEF